MRGITMTVFAWSRMKTHDCGTQMRKRDLWDKILHSDQWDHAPTEGKSDVRIFPIIHTKQAFHDFVTPPESDGSEITFPELCDATRTQEYVHGNDCR